MLLSYGPDGPDQFSQEFINVQGATDLVADYNGGEPNNGQPDVIDGPFNEDNVYLDDSIKQRLKEPLPSTD